MAKALKCDRCGCLYESYTPERPKIAKGDVNKFFDSHPAAYLMTKVQILLHHSEIVACVPFDLCPECRKSFIEWFNSPESK